MSVFDKRSMWTISTSNYAKYFHGKLCASYGILTNYLQCMTAQNDVEEDKFIDGGNPTLDSLRLCELYSTGIFVLDYEMFKQCIESTQLIAHILVRIHPHLRSSELGNQHHRKQQDLPPLEYPSRSCPQDQQKSAVLSIRQDVPAHHRQSERA